MKINCSIVDDLLPLYLEDMCSEDSAAALEEHLQECAACREKLARMKNSDIIPQVKKHQSKFPVADYAKKVRHHRICVGILIALISMLAVCILTLCGLTILDMHRKANPAIFEAGEGIYNLTSAGLESTVEEIKQYVFYTNTNEIKVTVQGESSFQGTVMLWDAEYSDSYIQITEVNEKANTGTFTYLSAARRYRITCDNLEGATIAVSDGRTISFWDSLVNVLDEIIGR